MAEVRDVEQQVRKLIVPAGIVTEFNGTTLEARIELEMFTATLPTELAGEDGYLRRVSRETTVRVFAVQPGETAMLYYDRPTRFALGLENAIIGAVTKLMRVGSIPASSAARSISTRTRL